MATSDFVSLTDFVTSSFEPDNLIVMAVQLLFSRLRDVPSTTSLVGCEWGDILFIISYNERLIPGYRLDSALLPDFSCIALCSRKQEHPASATWICLVTAVEHEYVS